MIPQVNRSAANLTAAATELVLSARRRQVAPSGAARAQHLGELEAKAGLLHAMGLTGGLPAVDVVATVTLCQPVGRVPEVGGRGLTAYINTWADTVAWMLGWGDAPTDPNAVTPPKEDHS